MSNRINTSRKAVFSKKSRALFVIILGLLSAFGPLSLDMYLPALPSLAEDLNTSASMAQLSLTACLLGLAAGQLIMGPFSDIRGRKIPLAIAVLVYAISSILCAFAPTILIFILMRFIQGIAGAAGMVISRASVRDLYSGLELTKLFAILMLVTGLAPIVAPVVGGAILSFVSWRGMFVLMAVLGGLMFAAVLLGLQETLPEERRKKGGLTAVLRTFGLLLKDRVFVGYAMTQGFIMAAMFAYISGSSFVLQDIYGLSPQFYSILFAINGVGLVISTQVTARLSAKTSNSKLLVYGLFIALAGSILLITAIVVQASVFYLCVALFMVVFSVGVVNTTVLSLAMESQSSQAGSASALIGLLPFLLGALVAPLVGIGNGETALPMGIVMGCCALLAIAIYGTLVHKKI